MKNFNDILGTESITRNEMWDILLFANVMSYEYIGLHPKSVTSMYFKILKAIDNIEYSEKYVNKIIRVHNNVSASEKDFPLKNLLHHIHTPY